jgi:hypothetical protein
MNEPNPIITLTDISITRENKRILTDVNLSVNRGDFMAVTGPNGGGKTTLMRLMLRLLRPTSGKVIYFDGEGRETANLSIGYLPQKNMIDSKFPITVSEVVELGIPPSMHLGNSQRREAVAEKVELVGLTDYADASIGTLSGGQLQRALMARAIISNPELLVLDEPLSYLDRKYEQRIYDIVAAMAGDTTIVLVSHDMSRIAEMANRHIIVDHKVEACHSGSHFLHYDCCENHNHEQQ